MRCGLEFPWVNMITVPFMKALMPVLVLSLAIGWPAHADEIPAHRAKQIHDAAPAKARVEAQQPRRVLIWITPPHLMEKDPHKGYCIPYGTAAMRTLGTKTGAFEPVVSDNLEIFFPENLRRFDAVIMNNSSGRWITPSDADMEREEFRKRGDKAAVEQVLRKSLLDYVENGGGIVGVHYAIGANPHWPEFQELFGARYGGHPWNEEIGVRVDEPTHPLAAAFGGKNFRIADEIYQFRDPYSRDNVRVLLSLNTNESNMEVKWIDRKDGDFALAWVKPHGQGRVFYNAFGHRTEIYWHPAMLQFFLDGIQFATGDLPADAAPRKQAAAASEEGFVSLFNGKDLAGWEGDPNLWSVRDGAITGQTTAETRLKQNQFLIWQGGQPGDFELRCQFKLVGGNSGIYFRAEKLPGARDPLVGPQADFSADHRWTGVLMEYLKRDLLAERGQRVVIDEKGAKQVAGSFGDPSELLKAVKDQDWNNYTVIARGGSVVLKINGVTMCEVTDHDPRRTPAGYLALQVHTGPPMTVQFRNIRMKQF
jgi:type 1 glutamine amidotransferase